ncbi:hypothetical protein [Parapedobacter sp. DT-150]|uniref:hypothetical protein n=1 Tax=Parapedobacter sp. DT-150 TaxID=3396162 RepID=UPI003F195CA5
MAIQDKNGKIRGKINNIVYRELGDKQVMQIAPARVKQTYATKLNAMEFGLASAQAKVLRRVFRGVYEEADGKMAARLTAAVAACIRTSEKDIGERNLHDADLDPLKGFKFNADAPFEKSQSPLFTSAKNMPGSSTERYSILKTSTKKSRLIGQAASSCPRVPL